MRSGGSVEFLKFMRRVARLFAYAAVFALFFSIIILVIMSFIKLTNLVKQFLVRDNLIDMPASMISANLLSVVDVYLLVIVLYIMALAVWKFFIGDVKLDQWLEIHELDDLKLHISKVIVLFLVIFAAKKIVEWESARNILAFGIIVVLICAVMIGYSMFLSKCITEKRKEEKPECRAPGTDM